MNRVIIAFLIFSYCFYASSLRAADEPAPRSISGTVINFCAGVFGGLIRPCRVSAEKSGLNKLLADFALGLNHPLQTQKLIDDLGTWVSQIEHMSLGPDFAIPAEEFEFLQVIARTSFSQRGARQAIINSVNGVVDAASRGERIDHNFVNALTALHRRLLAVRDKMDALAQNHLRYTRYYGEWVSYNPHGENSRGPWEAFRALLSTHKFDQPNELTEADFPKVKAYLTAYLAGTIPFDVGLSGALLMLQQFDKGHDTNHYRKFALPVFNRAIDAFQSRFAGQENVHDLGMSNNRDALEYALADVLRDALQENSPSMSEVADAFLAAYRSGKTSGILEAMATVELYFIGDEPASRYQLFQQHLTNVKNHPTLHNKEAFAEVLYLGFVSVCVKHARLADRWLSEGGGLHNAIRVNTAMEEAALATKIFQESEIRGAETRNLDFDLLAQIFRGMQYDNSGRRSVGDGIGPLEAFGIGGARRQDRTDPYSAVSAYIVSRMTTEQLAANGGYLGVTRQPPGRQ